MKVVLQSIYAGPDGCADAGQAIDLPAKEAKRLIKEGGAKEVKDEPKRTRSDNARGGTQDPLLQEAVIEALKKSPLAIAGAIQALDPDNDQDWDEDGKPSLDRLKELLTSETLTREEVDQFAPDALRPLPEPAAASSEGQEPKEPEQTGQADEAAKPAASGSGARSNKP